MNGLGHRPKNHCNRPGNGSCVWKPFQKRSPFVTGNSLDAHSDECYRIFRFSLVWTHFHRIVSTWNGHDGCKSLTGRSVGVINHPAINPERKNDPHAMQPRTCFDLPSCSGVHPLSPYPTSFIRFFLFQLILLRTVSPITVHNEPVAFAADDLVEFLSFLPNVDQLKLYVVSLN